MNTRPEKQKSPLADLRKAKLPAPHWGKPAIRQKKVQTWPSAPKKAPVFRSPALPYRATIRTHHRDGSKMVSGTLTTAAATSIAASRYPGNDHPFPREEGYAWRRQRPAAVSVSPTARDGLSGMFCQSGPIVPEIPVILSSGSSWFRPSSPSRFRPSRSSSPSRFGLIPTATTSPGQPGRL